MKLVDRVLCVTAGLLGLGAFVMAVTRGEGTVRYAVGIGALIVGPTACSLAARR